jgi:acyl-CoA synthetase (NDP forming)
LYSAGFGEAGTIGVKLEEDLLAVVAGDGVRVRCVGPNSNGVVSTGAAVFASIGMALEIDPTAPGPVALVTQSGAVGSSLLSRGWDDGIRFSRWVSTGNEVDISLGEYLEFLAGDSCTTVILLFIEGIRDGDCFAGAVARCVRAGKPVVAYKAGSSVAGRRAVSSHTGALAGDDSLYDAYFRTLGVARVSSLRGLLDAGRVLSCYSLPKGNRVALITMSGGAAAILSDECATAGLSVSELPLSVQEQLTAVMPGFGTVGNPLDVTAEAITDPSVLIECLRTIVACEEVDMVAVQLTTNADPSALAIAEGIVGVIQRTAKPVLVGRLGSPRLAPLAMQHYRVSDVPVFDSPEALIAAARVLATCGDVISRMSTAEETP